VTPSRTPHEAPYTLRQLQQMLGISRQVIAGLVRAGFVAPARGPRNEYRFSFQDVVLMRTAHALQSADISTRRILKSLRSLKASLPAELPLTGLRITAVGDRVAVRDGRAHWEPESGQLLMDFELSAGPAGAVARFEEGSGLRPDPGSRREEGSGQRPDPVPVDAQSIFERAQVLEQGQPAQAEALYRQALALAPDHADAWLNLGALLCETARCADAAALYERAIERCPAEALLYFNLGIALEDLGRNDEALERYAQCLARDPACADAHFNAARLHQLLGHQQLALRHFSAYRRLEKK
jgi:tetratricopeptide (TPR) repeat protein